MIITRGKIRFPSQSLRQAVLDVSCDSIISHRAIKTIRPGLLRIVREWQCGDATPEQWAELQRLCGVPERWRLEQTA